MGKRVRRRKQLLDDLKEKRMVLEFEVEAPNCTLWRIRFGRGCGLQKTDYGLQEYNFL